MITNCSCKVDPACPSHGFAKEFEAIARDFSVAFSKEIFGPGEEAPRDVLKRLHQLLDRQREARRRWRETGH